MNKYENVYINIDVEVLRLVNIMKNWIKSFALIIRWDYRFKCPLKQSTVDLLKQLVDINICPRKIAFYTKQPNNCLTLKLYTFK